MLFHTHANPYAVKRSWYSQTFSDDEEETIGESTRNGKLNNSSTLRSDDAGSDVSTEVGEESEYRNDLIVSEMDGELTHDEKAQLVQERPRFLKANRQQKIEQSKRVLDEFFTLDFDLVDASSQEGLVMRKLVLLKSLSDPTIYYNGNICSQETRMSLLGMQKEEDAFEEIALRAQLLCESRKFRSAFCVLREATALMSCGAGQQTSAEDMEAMKLRRMQKRQRQREERREQRRQNRKERSAQTWAADKRLNQHMKMWH